VSLSFAGSITNARCSYHVPGREHRFLSSKRRFTLLITGASMLELRYPDRVDVLEDGSITLSMATLAVPVVELATREVVVLPLRETSVLSLRLAGRVGEDRASVALIISSEGLVDGNGA